MEVPLTYLPGNVTRVKVTAVGDLQPPQDSAAVVLWQNKAEISLKPDEGDSTESLFVQ